MRGLDKVPSLEHMLHWEALPCFIFERLNWSFMMTILFNGCQVHPSLCTLIAGSCCGRKGCRAPLHEFVVVLAAVMLLGHLSNLRGRRILRTESVADAWSVHRRFIPNSDGP
jgi:hypothetical protein